MFLAIVYLSVFSIAILGLTLKVADESNRAELCKKLLKKEKKK